MRRLGQGGRLVGQVRQVQLSGEHLADLGAVLVDRGHEDVRLHVVAELNDQLGQIGLDRCTPEAASASLSLISSVTIDLTFTTSSTR